MLKHTRITPKDTHAHTNMHILTVLTEADVIEIENGAVGGAIVQKYQLPNRVRHLGDCRVRKQ